MHSKYSDGRATLKEMVNSARAKGLQAVAITDHGPRNVGTGVKNSETFLEIKKEIDGLAAEYLDIKLLCGCEADITGLNGEIDLPPAIYQSLDLLIVGLHPFARPDSIRDVWRFNLRNQVARISKGQKLKVRNNNTKTLVMAMEQHPIDIISHPGLGMPIDPGEVARACVKHSVLYEINCGHHFPEIGDVLEAAHQGVNFIVNSDAHFVESVGKLDYGKKVLAEAGLPLERVVNTWVEGQEEGWQNIFN